MIEILAPAGGEQALRAAVFAGADAVYMGGPLFSARAFADNFTMENLAQSIGFARERGVKVYVTLNTLLKDTELPQAMELVGFLCQEGVDGLIVQDMGLLTLLGKCCPNLPLHGSTQMSIHSLGGARLLKAMGLCRVVLARELALTEIVQIHQGVDLELEAFVHGALCMSVSGQCYLSAMLGSRSGNRGRCAQPCRLPFGAKNGTGYDLSLKDLSVIGQLEQLWQAGVCAAKIEGRMKRPEYVAAAVSAARHTKEAMEIPPYIQEGLAGVFSRSGFTDGYLTGRMGRHMFGTRTKEDVATGSTALMNSLHGLYKAERQGVAVTLDIAVFVGTLPVLTISDDTGNQITVRGEAPAQLAQNSPLDETALKGRIAKLGGTPYYAKTVVCHTDGRSAVPVAQLNSLRRMGVQGLAALRQQPAPIDFCYTAKKHVPYTAQLTQLRGEFASLQQVPHSLKGLSWVYLPLFAPLGDFAALLQRQGVRVGAVVPRAVFGAEEAVSARIQNLWKQGVAAFSCGNLGAVQLCRDCDVPIHGAYGLNITNTQSLAAFEKLGIACGELSYELTLREIAALGGKLPRGILLYGRQALMLTRNCPLANGGCGGCKSHGQLTDRKGVQFPVSCTRVPREKQPLYAEVFNSLPLSLCDKMHELFGVDYGILRFTVEDAVQTQQILDALMRQEATGGDYTRGLFYRGVQ